MKRVALFVLLWFVGSTAWAQGPGTGFPMYGSFDSGAFDSTNRYNLNTNFSIPIVNGKGRGLDLNFSLAYNSLLWKISSGAWVSVTDSNGNPTWGWLKLYPTGIITNTSAQAGQCKIGGTQLVSYDRYSNYVYYDMDGTGHSFPTISWYYQPCTDQNVGTTAGSATDGSGYYYDSQSGIVKDKSGLQITPGTKIKDTNGNYISSTVVSGSETDWKDSAGHNALKIVTNANNVQYEVLDPTGNYQTTSVNLTTYNIKTNFGCSGVTEYTGTASLPSSISLPNSLSYSITYEGTPSHSGYYTGRVSQITLPNGGYVQFQYNSPNDGINCTDGSILNLTRTQNDGTTSSPWIFGRTPSGANWVTTVTAPIMPYDTAANQSVYTFNSSGQIAAEQIYQGSSASGTLLRTINTTWATNGSPATAITILDDNHQSEIETTYDVNGNLQVQKEHDYGSGAPGTILRTTNYTYLSATAYTNLNILDRITEQTIADSNGIVQYRQDIAFDGTTLSSCPTGASQHDDANFGCTFTTRGNPSSVTTYTNSAAPSGGVTKNSSFDGFGNLIQADSDCCQSIKWNYSSTTQYSYPDSVVRGASSGPQLTTGYSYNPSTGQVASILDQNNQTTSFAYDFMRRPTITTRPDTAQIVTSYDDVNHAVSVTHPIQGTNIIKNTTTMDGLGHIIHITSLDGSGTSYSTTTIQTDGMGGRYKVSNPFSTTAQYWTETRHDALGRSVKAIAQDGSQLTYSYSGPFTTVTDPVGHQRKGQLDGLGRLAVTYLPDPTNNNSLTLQRSYSYSVTDQLASISEGSQTRTFNYDGMSRLTSISLPESGTTNFQFNTFNKVTQRTDARGVITTYTYDSLHRVYQVSYNVGGSGVPTTPTITYAYGISTTQLNNGRLLTLTDGLGSVAYTYDNLARVTQVQHIINGTAYPVGYQYNLAGQVTALTYPSGRVIQHAYDSIGRVSTVSSGTTTYASNFSYNAAFHPTGFNYGNGVSASIGVSADRLQLQSLTFTKGSTTVYSTTYSRVQNGGNNGQITGITDNVDSGRSIAHSFDALGRRTASTTSGSANYPAWGLSFTYDRYGNRTNQTVTAGTAFTNSVAVNSATNRITTSGYAYDANGNLTNDGMNAIAYDAENRAVTTTGALGSGTYSYPGSGIRAVKTSGGTTTVYISDGNRVIAEYAGGSLTNEYVHLGSRLLATHASGTLYYHVSDHQSIRVHLDTNGNIVGQQGHFPFGEDWYTSTISNRHFNNYQRDSESGNDYAVRLVGVNRLGRISSPLTASSSPQKPETTTGYSPNGVILNGGDPAPIDGGFGLDDPGAGWPSGDLGCDLYGVDENVSCPSLPSVPCFNFGCPCPESPEGVCPQTPPPPPPPPPPSSPTCFAQLKYRAVSMTGKNHSFWWIQDMLGNPHIISGGPTGSWPNWGFLDVWENEGNAGIRFPVDNSGDRLAWASSNSGNNCIGVEQMLETAWGWPQRVINYHPLDGPNSNSAAHYIGHQGGFDPPTPPPDAPGWDTPIPFNPIGPTVSRR